MDISQATKPSYDDKSIHQARLDSEKDLGQHITADSGQISESIQQVCHNDEILWRSKRKYHIIGLFRYIVYFVAGIFMSWCLWILVAQKSLWYVLIAIPCTLFYVYEIYKALNLKAILLTTKGLELHTRFDGVISYPYGTFIIKNNIEEGIFGIFASERITIASIHHKKREFIFPCGYDSFGSFENNIEFKNLCAQYTQNALEIMDMDKMANLYDMYASNIEYLYKEERNHNVFAIDFEPYKEILKEYFCKDMQNTFENLSIKKQLKTYKTYQKMCESRKIHGDKIDLRYDVGYLAAYKDMIDAYLKDKR